MRTVFTFIAGLTLGALALTIALKPRPCTCPDIECMGPVQIVPPPPRQALPPGVYLL